MKAIANLSKKVRSEVINGVMIEVQPGMAGEDYCYCRINGTHINIHDILDGDDELSIGLLYEAMRWHDLHGGRRDSAF